MGHHRHHPGAARAARVAATWSCEFGEFGVGDFERPFFFFLSINILIFWWGGKEDDWMQVVWRCQTCVRDVSVSLTSD